MAEHWTAGRIDELIQRMQQDEVADRIEESEIAKPIEYAKSRGIAPQKVYAALRSKRLVKITCPCGSLCVDKDAADTLFGFKKEEEDDD
jgi:hypothetical protein